MSVIERGTHSAQPRAKRAPTCHHRQDLPETRRDTTRRQLTEAPLTIPWTTSARYCLRSDRPRGHSVLCRHTTPRHACLQRARESGRQTGRERERESTQRQQRRRETTKRRMAERRGPTAHLSSPRHAKPLLATLAVCPQLQLVVSITMVIANPTTTATATTTAHQAGRRRGDDDD